jgi:membrane protein implicated in regulation of membrane protease activity
MLDLGIDLDVWPWVWLSVSVIFAIVELTVLGGSFILLPFAVSAFIASILGFYDVSVEIQWIVFVAGGGLLFLVLYRWVQRFVTDRDLPPGVGADRLVGMVGTVVTDIDPADANRRGRVVIDGEAWGAILTGEAAVREGTRVQVIGMQGTKVVVQPVIAPDLSSGEESS